MTKAAFARALGIPRTSLLNYIPLGIPTDDLEAARLWVKEYKKSVASPLAPIAKALGLKVDRVRRLITRGMPADDIEAARQWIGVYEERIKRAHRVSHFINSLKIDRRMGYYYIKKGMPTNNLRSAQRWIDARKASRTSPVEMLSRELGITYQSASRWISKGCPLDEDGARAWLEDRQAKREARMTHVPPLDPGKTYPNTTDRSVLCAISSIKKGEDVSQHLQFLAARFRGRMMFRASIYLPSRLVWDFISTDLLRVLHRAALKYDVEKCSFGRFLDVTAKWYALNYGRAARKAERFSSSQPFDEGQLSDEDRVA